MMFTERTSSACSSSAVDEEEDEDDDDDDEEEDEDDDDEEEDEDDDDDEEEDDDEAEFLSSVASRSDSSTSLSCSAWAAMCFTYVRASTAFDGIEGRGQHFNVHRQMVFTMVDIHWTIDGLID